ncbi:recombinase family protein [Acetobacterium tundrae]|uniref:Recombinase family protein n=1 Tax=Acetobacterium tundrae TaxID=132932 RepID=A0ABR6WPN3_9FIRM|nr:recombinase family protein [Acetobacterium tundrae]MBC3798458.1 recombinase family protein [Acetobacterium tundrae]
MQDKKAALYVRVSTSMQVDRDSLPFQRDELVNYSKYALNIDDYEIFEDAGFSAKNTDRPKYQEMMTRVRKCEFSHIIVWKIDRISRNLIDFCEMYEEIKKYDTAFISKNEQFDTSSAMGEAMLKIILVFAELERKLTGERVLSVMIDRASRGMWNGACPPLGYNMVDGVGFPQIDEKEAAIVRYIFELYEETNSSGEVTKRLTNEGIKTKRGGIWGTKGVIDILRNPFYVGTYRYNYRASARGKKKNQDEWVQIEDNHPRIIAKEQFERVGHIIDDNYKGNNKVPRVNKFVHLFARKLKCDDCGKSMMSGLDQPRSGGIRPSRYICANFTSGTPCKNYISDITLVPFMIAYLSNFIKLQEVINPNTTDNKVNKILLSGDQFRNIKSLDSESLFLIKRYLLSAKGYKQYEAPGSVKNSLSFSAKKQELILNNIKKYETAIERLEELYLFSNEAMSQKDFILKKTQLVTSIESEREKLEIENAENKSTSYAEGNFISKASYALLSNLLSQDNYSLDYLQIREIIGIDQLQKILNEIICKIVIKDGEVACVVFNNGLVHQFIIMEEKLPDLKYYEVVFRKNKRRIINHLKENENISATDLQKFLKISKRTTYDVIHHMLSEEIIVSNGSKYRPIYRLNKNV